MTLHLLVHEQDILQDTLNALGRILCFVLFWIFKDSIDVYIRNTLLDFVFPFDLFQILQIIEISLECLYIGNQKLTTSIHRHTFLVYFFFWFVFVSTFVFIKCMKISKIRKFSSLNISPNVVTITAQNFLSANAKTSKIFEFA